MIRSEFMVNAIKNYQKKRRSASRKAVKELRGVVHDAMIDRMIDKGMPKDLADKEREIFKHIYK